MNQQLATRVEPTALGILNRSEIDGQIAVARQYPRDLETFEDRSRSLATRDSEIAAECLYALPRDNKMIEGPSVRLAEILVANWGNCRTGARIIEEAHDHVVAQGIFHDLETNAVTTFETRRRIIDRKGRRYSPDMVNTTCNAACAIALRQAVLKGIPKPFWEPVFEAAKQRAAKDLPRLRQAALKGFAGYGIDEARIVKLLGVTSMDEVNADGIAQLRGLFQAIKEGELTAAEAFPAEVSPGAASDAIKTLDEFGQAPAKKPEAEAVGDRELMEVSAADHYQAGRKARGIGAKRDQYPQRIKDDPSAIEAWQAGYDDKDEEIRSAP